jgi:hypothetical protein
MSAAMPPLPQYASMAWFLVGAQGQLYIYLLLHCVFTNFGFLTSPYAEFYLHVYPSRKRAPDTHWIGGRVGPRAVLDAVVKRKIPSLRRESNHRTPIVHPVAQHYSWLSRLIYTSGYHNACNKKKGEALNYLSIIVGIFMV